ncbi:hypothetical protein H696_01160 [Fonticula alba]|uniref:Iron-binding zinc finger CDGSH type domain-containing protein n=1 Tax=Fonticula alba TaxID=691883 RepID=A0A058ZBG2_FONAL|nr:hypothetical protein H696_01160 [Fonticula alba]KCV71739.1 hypothetical protein H696_01160 [Fonticula alba]|eukprot:XP_009493317.1 hypothetical protein H696_01160 [Fonticula alba]
MSDSANTSATEPTHLAQRIDGLSLQPADPPADPKYPSSDYYLKKARRRAAIEGHSESVFCQPARMVDIEDLRAAVPTFSPVNVRGLVPGDVKLWCTCGLSAKQPWCDGAHRGTRFRPLKWVVPKPASSATNPNPKPPLVYHICSCKYTAMPPYCDGVHVMFPLNYVHKQADCPGPHTPGVTRLCDKCGWACPDLKRAWAAENHPELTAATAGDASGEESDLISDFELSDTDADYTPFRPGAGCGGPCQGCPVAPYACHDHQEAHQAEGDSDMRDSSPSGDQPSAAELSVQMDADA